MEPGIYGYILKYSKPQQIVLTLLAAISFPFYFFSLDLPKTIINRALDTDGAEWPQSYYGLELDQIPFLLVLCTPHRSRYRCRLKAPTVGEHAFQSLHSGR